MGTKSYHCGRSENANTLVFLNYRWWNTCGFLLWCPIYRACAIIFLCNCYKNNILVICDIKTPLSRWSSSRDWSIWSLNFFNGQFPLLIFSCGFCSCLESKQTVARKKWASSIRLISEKNWWTFWWCWVDKSPSCSNLVTLHWQNQDWRAFGHFGIYWDVLLRTHPTIRMCKHDYYGLTVGSLSFYCQHWAKMVSVW